MHSSDLFACTARDIPLVLTGCDILTCSIFSYVNVHARGPGELDKSEYRACPFYLDQEMLLGLTVNLLPGLNDLLMGYVFNHRHHLQKT